MGGAARSSTGPMVKDDTPGQWSIGTPDGDGRQPFGPLPVGEGVAGATWPLPLSLHVDQSSCIVSAITPAQRLRDATALIFCNVSDDSLSLVQPCSDMCTAFSAACGIDTEVEGRLSFKP